MAPPVFFSAYPFPISSFPLTCSCAPNPQRKHSCKLFLWGKEQGGHTPPSQPKRVCFRGLIAPEQQQRGRTPHVVVPLLPWRSVASTEGPCPVLRPVRHPWAPSCSVLAQKIGWRIFIYIFWLVKKSRNKLCTCCWPCFILCLVCFLRGAVQAGLPLCWDKGNFYGKQLQNTRGFGGCHPCACHLQVTRSRAHLGNAAGIVCVDVFLMQKLTPNNWCLCFAFLCASNMNNWELLCFLCLFI